MIKYSYGSSRGNKIWVGGHIHKTEDEWINIAIELNKDKSKSKINWIIGQGNFHRDIDITYEELKKEYSNDIIKEAYDFAKSKGYTKRWE